MIIKINNIFNMSSDEDQANPDNQVEEEPLVIED